MTDHAEGGVVRNAGIAGAADAEQGHVGEDDVAAELEGAPVVVAELEIDVAGIDLAEWVGRAGTGVVVNGQTDDLGIVVDTRRKTEMRFDVLAIGLRRGDKVDPARQQTVAQFAVVLRGGDACGAVDGLGFTIDIEAVDGAVDVERDVTLRVADGLRAGAGTGQLKASTRGRTDSVIFMRFLRKFLRVSWRAGHDPAPPRQ
jgi:hypothetical protein